MTTKKPPTMAALRKLAARKGCRCSILVQCFKSRVVLFTGTDLSITFDVYAGTPASRDELKSAVYFYLWILPDKPKKGKQ